MCVHGLTGCTVRIVAFDEFLILVNLVSINCSKLIHFDSRSAYCIIMSMRMVADVETLDASDPKDHNEFVTMYDVEGTQTELEKVTATFGKPTLSYVGALLAYSNALVDFGNPKLGEDNSDLKTSCSGACVSYTDHDYKSGLANIDKPKPSCGGAYVSYKHIDDNTGLANFRKPKPSSMAADVSCKDHGDKMKKAHSSPRKAIKKTKKKRVVVPTIWKRLCGRLVRVPVWPSLLSL